METETDKTFNYNIEHTRANYGHPNKNTPEQDALLAQQWFLTNYNNPVQCVALDDHMAQHNMEEDQCMDDDDVLREHHYLHSTMDEEIEAVGGNPVIDRGHYIPALVCLGPPPKRQDVTTPHRPTDPITALGN